MYAATPLLPNRLRGLTAWVRPSAYTTGTLARFVGASDWTQGNASFQPAVSGNNPQFDGTDDFLTPTAATNRLQDLFGASAKTMFYVVSVASAPLNNGTLYTNNSPFCDTGGYFGLFFRSAAKVAAYNWDGGPDTIEMDYTFGTKVLITITHDGVNLRMAINGGAWSSVASGATLISLGAVNLGRSYLSAYCASTFFELATYNVVHDDLSINKLRQSMMAYHKIF